MFGAAELGMMKPSAVLINTARGALVDEQALAAALREGRLAGAGLDTFQEIEIFGEVEAPPHHPLLELDNVIVTPHVAGLSAQASAEVSQTGVDNLVTVLAGHWPPPQNIVNPGVRPWFELAPPAPALLERIAAQG